MITNDEIKQIRELIFAASTEGADYGAIRGKNIDEHAKHIRESMSYAAKDNEPFDLYGVYLKGSEVVICHTGNGPHSAANAQLITFCFNNLGKLLDDIEELRPVNGRG